MLLQSALDDKPPIDAKNVKRKNGRKLLSDIGNTVVKEWDTCYVGCHFGHKSGDDKTLDAEFGQPCNGVPEILHTIESSHYYSENKVAPARISTIQNVFLENKIHALGSLVSLIVQTLDDEFARFWLYVRR